MKSQRGLLKVPAKARVTTIEDKELATTILLPVMTSGFLQRPLLEIINQVKNTKSKA